MKDKSRRIGLLIILLLAGAIIGGVLWLLLLGFLPASMNVSLPIGSTSAPWVVDLHLVVLTLGIKLNLNPGSVVGMIGGLVVYFLRK